MEETKNPGTALAVVGILSALLSGCGSLGWGGFAISQAGDAAAAIPQAASYLVSGLLNIIFGGVVAFGGFKMRNNESYGLAMAASILAMLPFCTGSCCLLGLPVGIWCIITLRKDEVKNNFR